MFGRTNNSNSMNNSRHSSASKARYSRDMKTNHHHLSGIAGIASTSNSNRNESNNGGMCCVRVSLIVFNLVTILAGIACLGVGVLLLQQSHEDESGEEFLAGVAHQNNIPNRGEFRGFSILLIGLGGLVTFVSFIGCFGACIKSRCLLLSYLATVVLILSLQLLVSVFAIIYRQQVTDSIRDELLITVRHVYKPGNKLASSWDLVHQQFECCGVEGYSDWFDAEAWPKEKRVPESCCIQQNNTRTIGGRTCGQSMDSSSWYNQGCLGQIKFFIFEQLHILATFVITLVFLQLYGIISSTLLFYNFKPPKPKNQKAYSAYPYERARM